MQNKKHKLFFNPPIFWEVEFAFLIYKILNPNYFCSRYVYFRLKKMFSNDKWRDRLQKTNRINFKWVKW